MDDVKDENVCVEWAIRLNDAQLGYALNFGLAHEDAPAGAEVVFGSLATLRRDTTDDALLAMVRTGLRGLVQRDAAARRDAHRWHAQRQGCNPDGDAALVLDLQREVTGLVNLYRRTDDRAGIEVSSSGSRSYPTILIGDEAIAAFRDDYLVPRFGERSASATQLKKWLDKLDQQRLRGGLSVAGIVARILHQGRPAGTKREPLLKTVHRVDRVLRNHSKR